MPIREETGDFGGPAGIIELTGHDITFLPELKPLPKLLRLSCGKNYIMEYTTLSILDIASIDN